MKNKILIAVLMFFISVIALGSLSYAYFAYSTTLSLTTIKAQSPTYVTVSSEYEMHKAIYDPVDNANTPISKNRFAIKLADDIQLTGDMTITRDIALDLDTYKFDLNGYTLKILHTYEGKSLIKNATVGLDTGKFVNSNTAKTAVIDISTPNIEMAYDLDELIDQDDDIDVYAFSEDRLVSDVYQFVESRMFKYYWHDLALPTHYYNYDITFDYDFSVEVELGEDDDFINDNGHILHLPLQKRNATMTLNITSPLIAGTHDSLVVPFILLPGKPASSYYDERMVAAEQELLAYLHYYKWGLSGNRYFLYNDLQLPNLDSYYGLTAVYSATSIVELDDDTEVTLSTGDLSTINGHTVIHKYNLDSHDGQRVISLKVDYTFDEGGTITVISRTYQFNMITDSNYDIASKIIQYIGIIVVREKVFVLPYSEELEEYGIKSVSYSVVDSDYFEITGDDNNVISLIGDVYPPITDKQYLSITFEFLTNTPLTITSQTRIYCENYGSGEGEEVYDQYFDAYYDLHSRLVSYLDDGLRLESFQMPRSSLSRSVTYGLIRTSELPQDITTIPLDECDEIKLPNNDVIASVDNSISGYSQININFDKIPLNDTNVTLLYCFNGTSWYGIASSFIIPGVIRNDTILDINLFEIVKQYYDANNDDILLTRETNVTLSQPFEVRDVLVSDWSGIELLTNITELTIVNSSIDVVGMSKIAKLSRLRRLIINNCDVDNDTLTSIPKFERLVYLSLAHNNITSLANLAILPSLIELDISGNEIENISRLASYPSLQIINISDNHIDLFEDLRRISTLTTVRLYDNLKPGSNSSLYGSLGSYNITSFVILYRNGIDVYYRLDGTTEVLFVPTIDQTRGAEILEAISYTSNGNGKIELTTTVYNSTGGVICTISYTGADFNFTTPVNGKIYATIKPGLEESGKSYYIIASTIVNGTTVYRALEVVMP